MKRLLRISMILSVLVAQNFVVLAQTDRDIYDRVHGTVSGGLDRPMGELVLEVAKSLVGTPYVASALEVEPESLQVFLDKTDCILFVETCVALALTFKGLQIVQGDGPAEASPSYELFCHNIQNLRYRNGVVDGYPSRLHYTSEWIRQGESNEIFSEITGAIGEVRPQKFNFMSTHPDSYRQLKNNPENLAMIRQAERYLEENGPYSAVPGRRIAESSVQTSIKDGDILAFVSSVEGLDVTHVGIACTMDGELHFIHASTNAMKVIVEPRTLVGYVRTGVRVIRMN